MNNPPPPDDREIDPITLTAIVVALLFIPLILAGFFS